MLRQCLPFLDFFKTFLPAAVITKTNCSELELERVKSG